MAPKRKREELDWEGWKDQILEFYETQNKGLPETVDLMVEMGFIATERMYKTRFDQWGVRKYKKPNNPNGQGRGKKPSSRKPKKTAKTSSTLRYSSPFHTPGTGEADGSEQGEYPPGLWRFPPTERDAPGEPTPTLHTSPDLTGMGWHLDPAVKRRARAGSDTGALIQIHGGGREILTPDSFPTPNSFETPLSGSVRSLSPLVSPAAHTNSKLSLAGSISNLFNESQIPHAIGILQILANNPETRRAKLSRSIGSPSLSEVCRSDDSFQELDPRRACDESSNEERPRFSESSAGLLQLTPPKSDAGSWLAADVFLYLCEAASECYENSDGLLREHTMRQAVAQYGVMIKNQDDQALSALNIVIGMFCTGKTKFLAEFLQRARAVAGNLGADKVIVETITFMVFMAAGNFDKCEVDITALRRIANDASRRFGSLHKHSIVTKFNLGWRLAMDKETRDEALRVLFPLLSDVRRRFQPNHLQSIALLMVLARLLRYQFKDEDALTYATLALTAIQRWPIDNDHPNSYYEALTRRYKVFSKIRQPISVQR